MATAKQLREMSEVLTKHGQDLRENAERAQERSAKLRERADSAKLSSNANTAHVEWDQGWPSLQAEFAQSPPTHHRTRHTRPPVRLLPGRSDC